MNICIRKAEPEDLSFLFELEKKAFPLFQQNSKESLRKGIKSSFQEILIAELKNKIKTSIGSVVLFKYKNTLRLYSIAIIKEFQNKGLGDYLLKHVIEYANQNNFERIVLEASANNNKLIEWYKNKGFNQINNIKDYYCTNEDAIKMEYKTNIIPKLKKTNNLIVINQPFKWDNADINANIISVKEYINNPIYQNSSDYRVFNLCSSYKYQSYGYYISLLASARGQRVIPSIATIRDFRIINVIHSAAYEVDELINQLLKKHDTNSFSLNIYFGQTTNKAYNNLANKLYLLFEAPLFKVNFIKHDKWLIKDIKILTLKNISAEESESLYTYASNYFNKKRYNLPKLTNYKYDLAILVNPNEVNPPSNQEALQRIKKAANKKGLYVEFITKNDADKINEFDALFIRETTNVNHHTYEMSRLAFAEGLVVIDDPWSIMRCSNKIYQNELFKKHKIRTPKTTVLTKNLFEASQLNDFKYPLVLKQPDSAFSLGVIKVNSKEEVVNELHKLFKISDMVICQEFLYSEFDWRIGILDNKPYFACKYYMSKDHWQIYNWNSNSGEQEGDSETLNIEDVPTDIVKTALKAASLIGDGLYGVDLKLVNGKVYVVEVNDNPNLDYGIEDIVLKDQLYDTLIDSIINRIEIAKNIRKINFTTNKLS
ncbi:GNAT family N-acetyltransferase [Plebeiibacterium sediminum]|uniref:GNAT family N-acetyltransferase n=1 Tax=Plebeiibacterium sediminum TaxID=2992112 RepID=A0AAE3SFS9_9BACT|nr:GNAT family N-acetyltransferase [Plebeiobacterium sediminum]MCW3787412.1 GNAT family N-acetyltransferase [Plebeiobacterium sediminum]